MKNLIAILLLAAILQACHPHERQNQFITSPAVTASFVSGKWKVTQLTVNGKNKLIQANYSFQFHADNTIQAHAASGILKGHWSISTIKGTDNSPVSDFSLNLKFDRKSRLFPLSRNWQILHKTVSQIVLGDCGNGNGSIDSLVLEKDGD